VWVCYHDNSKLIDLHQIGFVGKGSDHLQPINFWPSYLRPRGGDLRRDENFWLSLATASAQCLRLCERFLKINFVVRCNLVIILIITVSDRLRISYFGPFMVYVVPCDLEL